MSTICLWSLRALAAVSIIISLLPLWRTGAWYVRVWDFPRFQIACITLFVLLGTYLIRTEMSGRTEFCGIVVSLILVLTWQCSHFWQFTPLCSKEVPDTPHSANEISAVISNLDFEAPKEHRAQAVAELIELDADILVLIEVDEHWQKQLSKIQSAYPHRHGELQGEGLGLAVWSRFPMIEVETRFLVEDRRPSIWCKFDLDNRHVNFVALHPTPPGLNDSTGSERRDSRVRDAELILVAKEVAARSNESWIIAGDFNDVAWSHTTRMFKRLSGLSDPRIGRYLLNSFHAQFPLLRFPIDQIYVSNGFSISKFSRHKIMASDHFAIAAKLHLSESKTGATPEPQGDDTFEAKVIINEGKQDASDRNINAETDDSGD